MPMVVVLSGETLVRVVVIVPAAWVLNEKVRAPLGFSVPWNVSVVVGAGVVDVVGIVLLQAQKARATATATKSSFK
jgi:hypothetical protein